MKDIRANPNRNIDKPTKIQPTAKIKLKLLIESISTNKFFLSLNLSKNKLNNIIINAINIIDAHVSVSVQIDIISIIFQYIY